MDRQTLGVHYLQGVPKGSMPPHGELSREVSRLLETAADELGVSDTKLARLVGISQPQMSKYLRGERSLTVDLVDRICQALGLSTARVIVEADKATSNR